MEPISILVGSLGATFLEEGIKFLWNEAGKIIERYHKRKEGGDEKVAEEITDPVPAALQRLEVPDTRRIEFEVVAHRVDDLERLYGALGLYASGKKPIKAGDAALLSRADELQLVLSEVFRLPRPAMIDSTIVVEKVEKHGRVIGVDLEGGTEDDITSRIAARSVDGTITGVKKR
jgi:hypothetical protein